MATLGQAHRFPTVIPLIAANAAPIVGVLFFGWDLLSIMFLYWMETTGWRRRSSPSTASSRS